MTFDPNNPDSEDFDPFKELFGEDVSTVDPDAPSTATSPVTPASPSVSPSASPTHTSSSTDLPTEAMNAADVAKVQWDLPDSFETKILASDSTTSLRGATPSAENTGTPLSYQSQPFEENPSYFWQKMTPLVWVAVVVALILLMAISYIVGDRISSIQVTPVEPEPTQTAQPLPEDEPVPPGTYRWTELHGGECISFFRNAWQEEFVVIDCSIPHAAQLIRAASLTTSTFWPETAAYERDLPNICQSPEVLDLEIAGNYADIQLSYSYPTSQAEYRDVEDRYFCFISRSSGEPLNESLMPAPVIEEDPEATADPNA